ncbi:MAG TPA: hypothetical protein VF658_14590 [Pyrinomonadaceae bacterium]|jgi:hypothetical protein
MKRLVALSLLTLCLSSLVLAQSSGTLSAPSAEGTSWVGTVRAPDSNGDFHDNAYQIDLLSGNRLHWKWNDTLYTNGTWRQNGRSIRMELNDGYSTWLGTIEGNRMSGNSTNKPGHKWSWTLTRRSQPNVVIAPRPQAPAGWILHSSTAGRFSILMPSEPKVQEQPVDTAVGKLINHIFLAQKGSAAFAISYADYPQNNADPQGVLDTVRDGAINGIKGTLVSGKNITHKTFPGREFQASTQGALYTSRIFLVNNRLYQMVVVAPVGHLTDAEVNRFLTSFDLKLTEQ